MKTISPSAERCTPTMRFRVVCGLSETMASFSPTSRLRSVDLPALGRPTRATNPRFMDGFDLLRAGQGRGRFDRREHPHAGDAASFGLQHFDGEPVNLEA